MDVLSNYFTRRLFKTVSCTHQLSIPHSTSNSDREAWKIRIFRDGADALGLYGYLCYFFPRGSPNVSDHNMNLGAVVITMATGQWRSGLTGSNAMNDDDE